LDGAHVLVTAMNRLHFPLATEIACDLGRGDAQREKYEKDENDHADQHESLFAFPRGIFLRVLHG